MCPRVSKRASYNRATCSGYKKFFWCFPETFFCVSATNFVTCYNVSVAKLRNIQDACSMRQCCALHVSQFSLASVYSFSDPAQNANISVRYHENTTDIGHHNSLVFLRIWLRRKPKFYLILRSSILYYIEQFSQQLIRLPDLKYLLNLLITKNLGAC